MKKASIINLEPSSKIEESEQFLFLSSGRTVTTTQSGSDDLLTIQNQEGSTMVKIRLTDEGSELEVSGAKLALQASEQISINAPNVCIEATDDVNINANKDVNVKGKMIRLN